MAKLIETVTIATSCSVRRWRLSTIDWSMIDGASGDNDLWPVDCQTINDGWQATKDSQRWRAVGIDGWLAIDSVADDR